jgi:voltage-gated potassium channel Kch
MKVAIGCGMIIATTVVHAVCMAAVLAMVRKTHADRWGRANPWTRLSVIGALVVVMFFASLIEAALWAVAYLATGAISGLEEAMYFSMVTFTTLGYGDVVVHGEWRMLASFEAANGIIMFGWTTALIVAGVHHLYFAENASDSDQ